MSEENPPPVGETPPPPPGGDVTPTPPPTPAPTPVPASPPPPAGAYGTPAAPPPAAYTGATVVAPRNGMGTAALIMGILQFVCLGTIGSILAIVFGKIGMNRAKRGEATNGGMAKAGFILGIVGIILSIITVIVLVIAGVFVGKAVVDSLDMSKNSQTGLSDGNYGMEPNTWISLNDKCSFNGDAIDLNSGDVAKTDVTVVGEGSAQCGTGGSPSEVYFDVAGGVAKITEVK